MSNRTANHRKLRFRSRATRWSQACAFVFASALIGLSATVALAEDRSTLWQSRTMVEDAQPVRALQEKDGQLLQPVVATLRHFGEPVEATLRVQNGPVQQVRLSAGSRAVELLAPAVSAATTCAIRVEIGGKPAATRELTLKPVRKLTIYILPHSHTDIGYTALQPDIEKRQVQNLIDGLACARRTANYPKGSRFVWNVEVLWAADLYLRRLDNAARADFLDAVKNGQVVLNGMYLNELTGLCRPEELLRLFRYATKMADLTGVPIESAMISDVPGYTWGTVPAMAQGGIRYFSTAPNYFARIGTILQEWENKPFYWIGPDGQTKVLVWIPFFGYALSHVHPRMSPQLVDLLCQTLDDRQYPYDIAHVRWSGHGDNAVPDPAICEFVKDWNAKYAWPRFIISGTSEAFRALEERYGEKLPRVRGDWTPYWEDGAGSSARETAMNRHSSDRLAQAETLFALLNPKAYPAAAFEEAWNHALLYSEHTWGAWCSVNGPQRQETKQQWEIKKSYAEQADKQSRELFAEAIRPAQDASTLPPSRIDVINTLAWPRTELVRLPRELSIAGDRITDEKGKPVPSQRLASGELLLLAQEVPPLACKRFLISAGTPFVEQRASVQGAVLDNGRIRVRVDENRGGIVELTAKGLEGNFADTRGGEAINDYLYLLGDDTKSLKRSAPARISVRENGPLLASLLVESEAPGCKSLRREICVGAGLDYIEITNLVDKARLEAKNYLAKEGKESVNFAFPFNVPDGEMRLDVPFGVMRPEADQMPSACKNWFTVGRWADVSNQQRGITWVTLDAPLVEVGALSANLLNSMVKTDLWRQKVDPTQKFYCWAMNNHWDTNYRAYQEGPVEFRFLLHPHGPLNPADASRFAISQSHPLVCVRAGAVKIPAKPPVIVHPSDVLATAIKPSDDGKAWIVRLFGASGQTRAATLTWGDRRPKAIFLSDTSEARRAPAGPSIPVPGNGLVTLRVEFE